jgi:hypothetical protein
MSARQAALAVALVFVAAQVALAQDDRAVPRGGGSSGGSSGGRGHHSGGASSSGDTGSSSSGSHSGGSASRREPTGAQARHPRAGTGTGFRRETGSYYYGSPFYRSRYYGYGYYGSPYYGGWGMGYSPYYYSGYYGYSPYYYGGRADRAGAVRVLVEPNETRVYVDGYYAGVADDFDGIFQRLNLAPGRHDISLRLDGYRTQNFKLYVPYDHTIKIHHTMTPGSPTDVSEETLGRPEDVADAGRGGRYRYDDDDGDGDEDGFDADDREEDELGRGNARGEVGTLRLTVEPSDASVYVDGAFRGTGRLRSLRLPAGHHRIEVVRPGYRTLEREVDVPPGREVEVRFDLERS